MSETHCCAKATTLGPTAAEHSRGAMCPQPAKTSSWDCGMRRCMVFASVERRDAVERSPHEEHGHFELRQKVVDHVLRGEHGGERALHDPAIAAEVAQNVASDEGGDGLRLRREEGFQLVELGDGGRREERGVKRRRDVEAGGVKEHEAADALGMLRGDEHGNPSAHGPAAELDLLEAQRVHEAHDHGGLVAHRIGEIRGPLAAAVAEEIGNVDAETGLGEIRRKVAPVLRAAAEPVHENDDGTVGRALGKIVHAMARDLHVSALDAGEILVQVRPRVEVADGAEVESDGREQRQSEQGQESPLDPTFWTVCGLGHGLSFFLFAEPALFAILFQ